MKLLNIKIINNASSSFHTFIGKRKILSRQRNFFESLFLLLPIYSIFSFLTVMQNPKGLHISSLGELIFAYCFFIFIAPGIVAANHSFIFATIMTVLKSKVIDSSENKKKTEINEYYSENNLATYHKNELKISNLFKK